MKEGIKQQEELEKSLNEQLEASVQPIGNIVHDSVPISDDEVGAGAPGWGAQGSPGQAAPLPAISPGGRVAAPAPRVARSGKGE